MLLNLSSSLVLSLMSFASFWSGLPIPQHYMMPQIVQTDIFPVSATHSVKLCNNCNTSAVTNKNGTIFVDMQWRADDPASQCILAHELTHWLQLQNGYDLSPAEAEPPAYYVESICVEKKIHDKNLERNLISQARKYGYGHYKTSVW